MTIPYYRFFTGDYAKDTRHLSLMQHGTYRLLIDLYMDTEKPLRNELPYLHNSLHAKSGKEKKTIEFILNEFFTLTPEGWWSKRCEEEIAWRQSKSLSAKESIKKRVYERNTNEERTKNERYTIQNQNQNQNQKTVVPALPAFELPSWLPKDTWAEYLAHRRAKRAKMTPKAMDLAIKQLEKFRDAGHNPVKIVEQSILHGWTGLFQPKNAESNAYEDWLSEKETP